MICLWCWLFQIGIVTASGSSFLRIWTTPFLIHLRSYTFEFPDLTKTPLNTLEIKYSIMRTSLSIDYSTKHLKLSYSLSISHPILSYPSKSSPTYLLQNSITISFPYKMSTSSDQTNMHILTQSIASIYFSVNSL